MKPAEDAQDRVTSWFEEHERPLPWRAPGTSPWGVLVSEVMAQQTPVARVAPAWQHWLDRWPTPADLAGAPTAEVLRAWGSLGYPRRALRLQETARRIVQDFGGVVPSDVDALRSLPGIGEYTAAAVAVFAFGRRHAVLDTNVRRVLSRAFCGQAEAGPSLSVAERALARELLPVADDRARVWSVAVMELGALVCTARKPDCPACPLAERCRWLAAGHPTPTGPRRGAQAWAGTDRQARGRIMRALRDAGGPLEAAELAPAWPEPDQRARCLASLLSDGLVVPAGPELYALPGETLPEETRPSGTRSGDSAPGDSTPDASTPRDSTPRDSTPGAPSLVDTAPIDTAHIDTALVDTAAGADR